MFSEPTGPGSRKGQPPTIRVTTDTLERALKPECDDELFTEAACKALTEAANNGYASIAHESVVEFITTTDGDLIYQYVWMFSAWDKLDSK